MERALKRLFLFFLVLFVALLAQLTYVQVWAAPSLKAHPNNTRALEAEMRVQRGVIVTDDGVELAVNREKGPYYLRDYPQASLTSPWLGYNSLRYGRAGVERVYNEELAGEAEVLAFRNYLDVILGRPRRGSDVKLTIDSRVQEAAVGALGGRKGAVVALDPKTGAVLAMTSYPRYDPNDLETDWKDLNADPSRPLFNRATQGLYPPGSVFKMVVAAAALEEGEVIPATAFDDTGSYKVGGYIVKNFGNKTYGKHDFATAFVKSINTTFAKVGVQLGGDTLSDYSQRFGFDQEIPWDLGGATSSFPDPADMDVAHVAQVSFGQGELLASPLQIALVTAGIANGGRIMQPYIVDEFRDYHQTLLKKTKPSVWLTPISASTAETLRALMVDVVRKGTGTNAAIGGVQVAGKTGTAEVGSGEPHAWFAGFAPAADPQIAVVVLIENGGTGGAAAAPVAREVMAAALNR